MNGRTPPAARRTRRVAAALLASLALACKRTPPPTASADTASSLAAIIATCAAAVGQVEVRRAGKAEWSPMTTGAVLRVADTVRTLAGGFVRVEFLSGNGIELEESSTAVVDLANAVATAPPTERVSIEGGVARGFFSEKAGGAVGPVTIRTPDGREATLAPNSPGVRFRLTAISGGTEIAVTTGTARVMTGTGEVALASGTLAELATDGLRATGELIGFPESVQPNVDARFQLAPGLSLPFTWTRVAGAAGYRIQIARDLSFRELVLSRDVTDPAAIFAPSAPGMYAWRVASRDAAGRYGEYGYARRVYCDDRARTDLLVTPANDAQVRAHGATTAVRFAWQRAEGARGYRLVVATGPDLIEREVRSIVTEAASAEVRLAPGVYFWGVYVDDDRHLLLRLGERRDPIFVNPRRLIVHETIPLEVEVPQTIREWGTRLEPGRGDVVSARPPALRRGSGHTFSRGTAPDPPPR